jgi:hypothetical protein
MQLLNAVVLALAGAVAAQSPKNEAVVTMTSAITVVATVFQFSGQTYNTTKPTTLTIENCPCTVTTTSVSSPGHSLALQVSETSLRDTPRDTSLTGAPMSRKAALLTQTETDLLDVCHDGHRRVHCPCGADHQACDRGCWRRREPAEPLWSCCRCWSRCPWRRCAVNNKHSWSNL